MPLSNAGRNLLTGLLTGSGVPFTNGTSYIGVGDSSVAFDATQTDLQSSSNKVRKAVDVSFPSVSGNVLTFQATFSTGEANFAWQEWGVFNDPTGPTMLNRKVESLGAKTSTQSWQLSCTLTVNNS